MPFSSWWREGDDHVFELVDPSSGIVLGEVRPAVGHTNSWVFSWRKGSIGICGDKDFAMRIVEDKAALIGEKSG